MQHLPPDESAGVLTGVPSGLITGLPTDVQAGVLNGVSYSLIPGLPTDVPAVVLNGVPSGVYLVRQLVCHLNICLVCQILFHQVYFLQYLLD